jgi:hypothetical protein
MRQHIHQFIQELNRLSKSTRNGCVKPGSLGLLVAQEKGHKACEQFN